MVYNSLLIVILLNFCFSYNSRYGSELYKDSKNARNAALGGTSISYKDGSNLFNAKNKKRPTIHFSQKNKYGGLLKVGLLSYLYTEGEYPIYMGITSRSIDNIPDTREAWEDDGDAIPDNGEINYGNISTFSQQEIGLQFSSIRNVGSYLVGLNIKPSFISLAEYKAFGFSSDLSTIIQPKRNIDIIVRLEDIINIISWDSGSIENFSPLFIGAVYYTGPKISIGLDVGSRLEEKSIIHYHFGLEYNKQEQFLIRLGTSYKNMITAGIGIRTSFLEIDYAYLIPTNNKYFKASHILSIGISLKEIRKIKGKITS